MAELIDGGIHQQRTLFEDADVIRNALNLGDLVRREKNRDTLSAARHESSQQVLDADRIESFARLIQDEKLWPPSERQQQGEFGPHSLGKRFNLSIRGQFEVEEELLFDVYAPVRVERTGEVYGLLDGHIPIQRLVFCDVSDSLSHFAVLFRVGNLPSKHLTRASSGFNQTEEHLDRRAFACAVSTQEGGNPITANRQV